MADSPAEPPYCVLVANKTDLTQGRVITVREGKKLADSLNIPYFECSAKLGTGVTEIVQCMADELVRRVELSQTKLPNRPKSGKVDASPFRVAPSDSNTAQSSGSCPC